MTNFNITALKIALEEDNRALLTLLAEEKIRQIVFRDNVIKKEFKVAI